MTRVPKILLPPDRYSSWLPRVRLPKNLPYQAIIDLNFVKNAVGIVIGHNSNIVIQGITFQNMYGGYMIKIGASKDVVIKENVFTFSDIRGDGQTLTIMLHGAKNPTVKKNTFAGVDRAIQISPSKNNGNGSEYRITYNTISDQNKRDMQNNYATDLGNISSGITKPIMSLPRIPKNGLYMTHR